MRVRRALSRLLVPLALAATLPATAPAGAAPPEGCIGFPSIPEAFVCIDEFSPENAVPHVAPGPGQTFVVPEFCVFECVGPTPLTVPNVVVTPGSGVVVTVTYNGRTESVVVPPSADPSAVVAEAGRAIADSLATVLRASEDAPAGALTLTTTMDFPCYGCGQAWGTLDGTATGFLDGVLVNVPVHAEFTMTSPGGVSCVVTASASGSLNVDGHVMSFNWTMVGGLVVVTTNGAINGMGVGEFVILEPVWLPCGGQVTGSFTLRLAGVA